MDLSELEGAVTRLTADRAAVRSPEGHAIDEIVDLLDRGVLRVCEPGPRGWVTHAWVKQAILLYFARHDSRELRDPQTELTFYDKVPTKRNYAELGVRCVPPGVARYGSFLARGSILMPGFVNIGAYVDEGTMVDTWATVGSCAQIGKGVHLSGGVGIGGVLEPAQAQPVIVEDGCFIGSRAIVVEGVVVEHEAVLGANVVLTASTPIVNVTGSAPVVTRGRIPARSVVIPGTMPKRFTAGEFQVPCALIIGQRQESTDRKTSLNAALRDFGVSA
ncbi:2,3,4,5-tetrahydropyridine-2,6-dicarboxylate N-succinyltransferase [bacterium]|nr:MAG: 2,3,4,5-tetrahydropyridine-2,6-dicarboxylate N-succinyltransferase [bacterium]